VEEGRTLPGQPAQHHASSITKHLREVRSNSHRNLRKRRSRTVPIERHHLAEEQARFGVASV
jgi:hypothetical protein